MSSQVATPQRFANFDFAGHLTELRNFRFGSSRSVIGPRGDRNQRDPGKPSKARVGLHPLMPFEKELGRKRSAALGLDFVKRLFLVGVVGQLCLLHGTMTLPVFVTE